MQTPLSPQAPARMSLDRFSPAVLRDRNPRFAELRDGGAAQFADDLTERWAHLRLAEGFEPRYVPNVSFRMLETLPVSC